MKAVQDQTEMRVVGALDDRPRLRVQIDRPSPCERLEAYPQIAARGPLGKLIKLRRHALLIRDELWRGVRAHKHERRAQGLHDVELPLGAIEVPAKDRVG